jgi:ATP-dependent Clp protease ATP-binding subunit ClpX
MKLNSSNRIQNSEIVSSAEITAKNATKLVNGGKIPTPKEIMAYLDERVIGQQETKKRLAIAVHNHYKRVFSNVCGLGNDGEFKDIEIDKSNVIVLGPTGSGKTFLIQNIAKMLGVPCHIHDCTKLTEAGYVGEDVENILTGLLMACDYDIEKAQVGIVCLDEIDKLAKRGENMSLVRDVSGEGVQQSLLKIVEGSVVGVMPQGGRKHPEQPLIPIDTTNILFIGMGAFVGIEDIIKKRTTKNSSIGFNNHNDNSIKVEDGQILDYVNAVDLKKFGLIPELIGRFPVITHTNPLKKEDLIRIIKEPKNSIMKQYQKLAYIDGKKLKFTDGAIDTIAETAIVTETGARGIRSIMETVLNDFMFDISDSNKTEVTIDKSYCEKSLKQMIDFSNTYKKAV